MTFKDFCAEDVRKMPAKLNKFDVFRAVQNDLRQRDLIGWSEHGIPLDARKPGKDWLQEHYEELLDACVYIKAELIRRNEDER